MSYYEWVYADKCPYLSKDSNDDVEEEPLKCELCNEEINAQNPEYKGENKGFLFCQHCVDYSREVEGISLSELQHVAITY